MKTTTLLLAATLMLAACHKQGTKQTSLGTDQSAVPPMSMPAQPGNPANPYDSAGIIHNLALEAVARYQERSGDLSDKGAFLQISTYFNLRRGNSRPHLPVAIPIATLPAMLDNTDSLLGSRKVSVPVRLYLSRFTDELMQLHSFDPVNFKQFVMGYEQKVAGDPGLKPEEKKTLLISLSIARHSGFYWEKKLGDKPLADMRKKPGIFRKIAAFAAAVVGDCIAAVGLNGVGAPLDDNLEISVTGSEAMYSWITGAYAGTMG